MPMPALLNALAFVWRHPLNRTQRLGAVWRFVRWHIGSRLLPGAVVVPFEVLAGASEPLRCPTTLAILMELNGSGARYGFDEAAAYGSRTRHRGD